MKKITSYVLMFAAGVLFGGSISLVTADEKSADKLAYMIVSSDRLPGVNADDYAPYRKAAGPLAREQGINVLARGKSPLVLEGRWPYQKITIETFPSMQSVKDFWYSDEYQQAKKLREGLSTVNFIIAVEGD